VQRTYMGAIFNLLGVLCYYGAYVLIIFRVVSGTITLGELTFLSGAFNRLRNNLQGFFSTFTRITESALYLKDYFAFIDYTIVSNHKRVSALTQGNKRWICNQKFMVRLPGCG
jgi:ATP-binding cassette, subfamily B, bacterial